MEVPVGFNDCEDVEEGEIGPKDDYDPAFEYPGGNEVSQYSPRARVSSPSPPPAPATNRTTVFRLISLRSTVLSRSKHVAILDGLAEVSIGRDVVPSARVRLKEMAVSKFHASIYWDSLRREWSIVDMGSMHGTFVRSAQDPSTSTSGSKPKLGTRLSDPRKASMPKVLRHLDEVTVGGTTFLVHEHLTGRPCPDCVVENQGEIPLFSSRTSATSSTPPSNDNSRKRKRTTDDVEKDPKKALAKLKSSLLSRHLASNGSHSTSDGTYKDRSALRRELHPEPRAPSLPASTRINPQEAHVSTPRVVSPPSPPPPPPPPAALPSTNIGHKLLLLQGWNPGMALGEDPENGLVEPLNLSANAPRAGLGSSTALLRPPRSPSQLPGDWREEAKRRRWDGVDSR